MGALHVQNPIAAHTMKLEVWEVSGIEGLEDSLGAAGLQSMLEDWGSWVLMSGNDGKDGGYRVDTLTRKKCRRPGNSRTPFTSDLILSGLPPEAAALSGALGQGVPLFS